MDGKLTWKSKCKLGGLYGALLLATCLALGVMNMFSRAITLDSVRSIDFQLVSSSLSGKSASSGGDRELFYGVTKHLATESGFAFYPLAFMDESSCVENNRWPRICETFSGAQGLSDEIDAGEITRRYGVDILRTNAGDYYFVGKVPQSESWLVGGAGKYMFSGDKPFGQEVRFLSDIGEILDVRSLAKMAEKSVWTWVACFIVFLLVFVFHIHSLGKAEKRHQRLYRKNKKVEKELARISGDMTRLSHEKLELEIKMLGIKEDTDEEAKLLWQELEDKERELAKIDGERKNLIMERDALSEKISENWEGRQSHLRKKEAEQAFQQLHDIKKLWLTGPDWLERHNIEVEVAADSLERAPFTEFIAFIRMEWYLKTMCELKKIYDVDSNEERINALKDRGFISKVNANLLHEVRRARNRWFHDGRSPDRSLVERFLRFLEGQKNPRVKPEV